MILEEFVLKFPANFSRHLANICLIHLIKKKEITLLSIFQKFKEWGRGIVCSRAPRGARAKTRRNPHVLPILLCHETAQKSSLIIPLFKVKLFSFRYHIVGFLFAKACRAGILLVSGATTCMFKCSLGPSFRMDQGFGVESKPVAISGNTSSSPKLKEVHVWVVWKGLRTEVWVWFPRHRNMFYKVTFLWLVPEAKHVLSGCCLTQGHSRLRIVSE